MPARPSESDMSLGHMANSLGKLEAAAQESQRQRDKLFAQNERQLEMLAKLDKDTSTNLERLSVIVQDHEDRLTNIEPRLKNLEDDQQRRKGAIFGIGIGASAAGAAGSTGILALLRKWGWL